jgi:transcriptional regulator with XRE-family HTH domain
MSRSRETGNHYISERAIDSLNKKQPAVGAILRQKREEMGITQTAAAREMGISPQYVCDLEKGRALPGRLTIVRIAEFYGVPLEDLCG